MSEEERDDSLIAGPDAVKRIKKAWDVIRAWDEDKKQLSSDIRETKIDCAKEVGMTVKDINGIFKALKSRESGSYSDDYHTIAMQVEEATSF